MLGGRTKEVKGTAVEGTCFGAEFRDCGSAIGDKGEKEG